MIKSNKNNEMLHKMLLLSLEDNIKLDKLANKHNLSRSAVVRELIRNAETEKQENDTNDN